MSTLLVIEDDPPNRTLIGLQLEDLGCDLQTAEDGRRGLERVRAHPPDAVVLDLDMPVMDGFGFLRNLRQLDIGREIPVVVITATLLGREEGQRLRELGVARIFEKGSYDGDDLVACLKTILWEA